jgi:hypothetical protein
VFGIEMDYANPFPTSFCLFSRLANQLISDPVAIFPRLIIKEVET